MLAVIEVAVPDSPCRKEPAGIIGTSMSKLSFAATDLFDTNALLALAVPPDGTAYKVTDAANPDVFVRRILPPLKRVVVGCVSTVNKVTAEVVNTVGTKKLE